MNNEQLILEMKSRGWTKQTIKNYLYIINKFKNQNKTPKEYLQNLLKQNKSNSYYKINYAAIKFYYQTQNKNFKKENIKLPKKREKLPTILTKTEIKTMIEKTLNIKHKAIIIMLYSSGIRLSELINLKWENLDLKNNLLNVKNGKGYKDRQTIFSKQAKKYLKQIPKISEYIFISQRNKKYHSKTIQEIIKQSSNKANIIKHITPHTLRHSFATHLLEDGIDIRYIQSLLGHKKLETTQIYTQIARNKIKNIKNPLD